MHIPVFLANRVQPVRMPAQGGYKRIPDADVARMRTMYDIDMRSVAEVCAAFPDVHRSYVLRILNREVRK